MLKNYKVILVALLVGITIFSVHKYLQALKEKYDLLSTLTQIKLQVAALEEEKQNLLQTLEKEKQVEQQLNVTNSILKENLRAGIRRITKFSAELGKTKIALEQLNAQVVGLKGQNVALKGERDKLVEERNNLLTRLGSLRELKKALIELRKQALELGVGMREQGESEQGNRGFVVKDGKSTYPAKVRIEVAPAPSTVPKDEK